MATSLDENPFLSNGCEFTLTKFLVHLEERVNLKTSLYEHTVLLRNLTLLHKQLIVVCQMKG